MLYETALRDDYLQEALLIRFYLNILESLFFFCEEQDANGLMLTIDDNCREAIEVYRQFIITESQVITEKGEQTQIVISTHVDAYDELLDFIEKVDQDFCQTLWRNQRENPTIRQYLKSHALLEL